MTQWFHAEGNRERRGPMPAGQIVELFRSGHIDADTLVWRDGAGDWQPLRDFAAELGLDELSAAAPAAAAPPLPPPLQATATPPANAAGMPAAHPPRRGLSGCAIAVLISVILGMFLIAILAILAAIALPAYKDYTERAQEANVLRERMETTYASLLPLQSRVSDFVQAHGRCPENGDDNDDGFGPPEALAGDGLAEVLIGPTETGHCGIEAWLHAPEHFVLDGEALWFDYDTDTGLWTCTSGVADRYLPLDCRSE